MREPKTWISIAILTVIALHALPVVSYQGSHQTRWPILAWAMYAKSYPPGPVQTDSRHLVAVTAGGQRIEVGSTLVGLPRPVMGKVFVRPLLQGDSATARELFRRLNRTRTDPVIEIRAEQEHFVVSDTGLVTEVAPSRQLSRSAITHALRGRSGEPVDRPMERVLVSPHHDAPAGRGSHRRRGRATLLVRPQLAGPHQPGDQEQSLQRPPAAHPADRPPAAATRPLLSRRLNHRVVDHHHRGAAGTDWPQDPHGALSSPWAPGSSSVTSTPTATSITVRPRTPVSDGVPSRLGARLSVDALLRRRHGLPPLLTSDLARWPQLAHVVVAMAYFSTGITKLLSGGFAWMNGYTLQNYLLGDAILRHIPLGLWVAQHYWLCVLLSVGTGCSSCSTSYRSPAQGGAAVFLGGVLFHIGLYYVAGHPFYHFILINLILLLFLDPERVPGGSGGSTPLS